MSLSRRGLFGLLAGLFIPLPRATAAVDVQQDFVVFVLPDGRRLAVAPSQFEDTHRNASARTAEAESLGLPVPEYRRLIREKLFREQNHTSGYRSTLKKLTVTMPTDTVLISSRRLQQLSDSDILKLVKSNSVAIIR